MRWRRNLLRPAIMSSRAPASPGCAGRSTRRSEQPRPSPRFGRNSKRVVSRGVLPKYYFREILLSENCSVLIFRNVSDLLQWHSLLLSLGIRVHHSSRMRIYRPQ